ncbi:MAG: hypothetical protein MZV64_13705 [Ignavibacteriales bacterium]|nr:hypothetical protein [Ignavibacteriales bacterium]
MPEEAEHIAAVAAALQAFTAEGAAARPGRPRPRAAGSGRREPKGCASRGDDRCTLADRRERPPQDGRASSAKDGLLPRRDRRRRAVRRRRRRGRVHLLADLPRRRPVQPGGGALADGRCRARSRCTCPPASRPCRVLTGAASRFGRRRGRRAGRRARSRCGRRCPARS